MKSIHSSYDALIIGFGKGGKTLAAYLANQGWRVALVEQSPLMYGGTCINIACIPTKSLIHNAELGKPYTESIHEKDQLTAALRQRNFNMVDQSPNATVITGKASFVSSHQVSVRLTDTQEDILIEAERIFINTGAKPIIPAISGLQQSQRVFTSTTLIGQTQLPARLVIIGGGYIALEFASMYAQYGSKVTILDRSTQFLPNEDRDMADAVMAVLVSKGIRIEQAVNVDEIIPDGGDRQDTVVYHTQAGDRQEVQASAILVATGRQPYTEGLNLSAAGIDLDAKGYIRVNEYLQTNVPHIWAIGDVNGGPQFTYVSLDDYRIIRSQFFNYKPHTLLDRNLVAFSLFTSPPFSHVGLREQEALAKGYLIKVATLPAASITRAQILNETEGLLKCIVDADTDQILGCTLLCANSSELINLVQLAMRARFDYTVLRDTIYTHPSMSEGLNDLFARVL
ncbi:FAD-dependent oxidoreductase [Spirosoma endbachense]|uniref:SidA/IucD/PvdA family monooxygenase n=1 Tax=Spirosoma endbachense TaxID=2666025 RepID=A0A6P1VRP1_9BACT|nr:FAD-dependent oxidoreductase [Spirosoma endbachense]QHV94289.1 SidA/IucD/PvdA family monooxygenase [Spirosoma endbachense]